MPSTPEPNAATLGVCCFATFTASLLAMPFVKDAYSPIDETISQGAIGEHGYIQVLGFLALAAGLLTVAFLLRASSSSAEVRIASALVALSAAGVVVLAFFPTDGSGDDTTFGEIHAAAATFAFLTNITAMLWSARAFGRERSLKPLASRSLALGVTALALLITIGAGIEPVGLAQRMTVACEMIWLVVVALHLRRQPWPHVHRESLAAPTYHA